MICGHKRLGHPGVSTFERMQKENMVNGIPTNVTQGVHDHAECDVCLRGKQTRKPFHAAGESSSQKLDLLHMDVVGEIPVEGTEGEKYFLTVVDDFSKHVEARALSHKSEVPQAVKEIINYWELQHKLPVKAVRSDRGGEFVNTELHQFFTEKGIRHELSAPYTPQQNGKAERMNRSLKEKLRMLIFQSNAPTSLWPEALKTAVRLLNLRAVQGLSVTPFEAFWGRKPTVHYLRVWGCLAYVMRNAKDLTALGPRSDAGMFVGYDATSKAYRVLVGNKIKVSRDVHFVESQPGHFTVSSQVPADIPVESVVSDATPSGEREDDWDVPMLSLSQVVEAGRRQGADLGDALPGEADILRRTREVLGTLGVQSELLAANTLARGGLPEISGDTRTGTSTEEEPNSIAGDESETFVAGEATTHPCEPRGGGRYDLRERINEPDRFVPSVNVCSADTVTDSFVVTPPGQNGAREKLKFSASQVSVPKNLGEAMKSPQRVYWMEAMSEEMDSIDAHNTFEYVTKLSDSKVIPLIWVYAVKSDEFGDVVRFKARLVAQGCRQRPGVDYTETFAPVSSHTTRMVLLSLAAVQDFEIQQVNIKTAFLTGVLEEEVYVSPPPGFQNGNP